MLNHQEFGKGKFTFSTIYNIIVPHLFQQYEPFHQMFEMFEVLSYSLTFNSLHFRSATHSDKKAFIPRLLFTSFQRYSGSEHTKVFFLSHFSSHAVQQYKVVVTIFDVYFFPSNLQILYLKNQQGLFSTCTCNVFRSAMNRAPSSLI